MEQRRLLEPCAFPVTPAISTRISHTRRDDWKYFNTTVGTHFVIGQMDFLTALEIANAGGCRRWTSRVATIVTSQ